MSEDRLYQKAISLIKAKNYEGAKLILEELDSEQARALLNRVHSAISRQKQAALAQHSQTPEKPKNTDLSAEIAKGIKQAKAEEKQAKAKQQGIGCLVLLALCAVCWIGFMATMPQEPQSSIETVCEWQVMVGAGTCTPSRIMRDYRPMVDACYDIWRTANTYNIVEWANCLENKSVDLID